MLEDLPICPWSPCKKSKSCCSKCFLLFIGVVERPNQFPFIIHRFSVGILWVLVFFKRQIHPPRIYIVILSSINGKLPQKSFFHELETEKTFGSPPFFGSSPPPEKGLFFSPHDFPSDRHVFFAGKALEESSSKVWASLELRFWGKWSCWCWELNSFDVFGSWLETKITPENMASQKERSVFQASIFQVGSVNLREWLCTCDVYRCRIQPSYIGAF